ncbi:MAG: hypothetical protein NC453_02280 [Muribaculum sp.]|nr:hypothetical protein [Muribaculum sp.]
MQIPQSYLLTNKIASIITLIALTLTGCNDDVFVDIPKISITDKSINVGESTTIKIEDNISSEPYMQILNEERLIYNGKAQSFSNDFLTIEISIDPSEKSLTLKAKRNFYIGGVDVAFSHPDIPQEIFIYISQQEANFRPKMIEYTLNSWETANTNIKYLFMVDTVLNDVLQVPLKYRIISEGLRAEQIGRFHPNVPMSNRLFDSENYRVPAAAFDYQGFPILTGYEVRYNNPADPYFRIPEYALEADSAANANSIVSIPPGKGIACRIYVIADCNIIRYNIPLSNDSGYSLEVLGKMDVIVPKRFDYDYLLFDIK